MPAVNINKLTNANLYSSGKSFLGKLEEIGLPGIKGLYTDHKALGMIGAIKLPSGFEEMTGKMRFNAIYPDLITEFGDPYKSSQVQVRGNLETWDSSGRINESPVVAFMTIRLKDVLSPITLKQNDSPELESEYSATYYRLEVGGQALIEIDFFTNIFFVNGDDKLANYRAALGI